jgi:alkanesulfonate monooxygenase SsuD/methylene tetrahydromethanopterin reductase-like flavin-dependent oxidoreductase (luciferase family)
VARGFAISGAVSDDEAAALARAAEESGYTSIWLTIVATTDPVDRLKAALTATRELTVGLGVVPVDRFDGLAFGELPRRAVVGFGAGVPVPGSLTRLRDEVEAFKVAHPMTRVAIAGYGPRVLALAREVADCVVLNWMTPERLGWALSRVEPRPVFVYVASAIGTVGAVAIDRALADMRRYPYHARHQKAMGATQLVGAAPAAPTEVSALLARYEPATPVVNPVGASTSEERLRTLRFFAP